MEKNNILGIDVTNGTEDEILKYIIYTLEKTKETYYIVTPNPEMLVYAKKHSSFKTILNQARIALCDGTGLFWAGLLFGKPFKSRVTGVEMLEKLCKEIAKKPITVGFLGGRDGIAEKAAERLIKRYPGLRVSFVGQEWGKEGFVRAKKYYVSSSMYHGKKEKENLHNTKYIIHNTQIDILFVAYGFPKQEEWISENLDKGYFRIAMGVGGAFDYISGKVWRAPLLIRLIGFEWLFRLIVQPWRIKRQLALLEFVLLVIREKLGK